MHTSHVSAWRAGSTLVLTLMSAGLIAGGAAATDEAEKAEQQRELIGAKKCGICHKKEDSGAQHPKWLEGPHAKAFESLASEASIAKAKELGIGNPQEAPECLVCHVTAFPVMDDLDAHSITVEEGVSCESCHGAGGDYWKKKTMQAVFDGETTAESVGLIKPITEETCVECHNPDNPFHEEFDFETFWAQIAHPYPEGYGK